MLTFRAKNPYLLIEISKGNVEFPRDAAFWLMKGFTYSDRTPDLYVCTVRSTHRFYIEIIGRPLLNGYRLVCVSHPEPRESLYHYQIA